MAYAWLESTVKDDTHNFKNLQNGLRTGLERRLVDHTQVLEKFSQEQAKAAEETAFRRSEALLIEQLRLQAKETRVEFDNVHNELSRLAGGCAASEQRILRLEVQADIERDRVESLSESNLQRLNAASMDAAASTARLHAELRATAAELSLEDSAVEERRVEMGTEWHAKLDACVDLAVAARKAIAESARQELTLACDELQEQLEKCNARDAELSSRHDALWRETSTEVNMLQAALQKSESDADHTAELLEHRLNDCKADIALRVTAASTRANVLQAEATADQATKDVARRLQSFVTNTSEKFDLARIHADECRAQQERHTQEMTALYHGALKDARELMGGEVDSLREQFQCIVDKAEQRTLKASKHSTALAVDTLEETCSCANAALTSRVDRLQQDIRELTRIASDQKHETVIAKGLGGAKLPPIG